MIRALFVIIFIIIGTVRLSGQEESSVDNCIVIMGDSLPAGMFVAEFPESGVAVLQSERIANVLHDALQDEQILQYGIYDLSLAASAIAAPNSEPYLTSREFFLGRGLNCRYIVIFPFLNDLYTSDDGETGIAIYRQGLSTMFDSIREHSPDSHIVLMNFYAVTLRGVGELTYLGDVTVAHVDNVNRVHEAICGFDLHTTCLALADILNPIEDHVLNTITRADFDAIYMVVNPDDQTMVDRYWANTPNNPILGDGLHLNPDGQVALVAALIQVFKDIDPVNFAPILP